MSTALASAVHEILHADTEYIDCIYLSLRFGSQLMHHYVLSNCATAVAGWPMQYFCLSRGRAIQTWLMTYEY